MTAGEVGAAPRGGARQGREGEVVVPPGWAGGAFQMVSAEILFELQEVLIPDLAMNYPPYGRSISGGRSLSSRALGLAG